MTSQFHKFSHVIFGGILSFETSVQRRAPPAKKSRRDSSDPDSSDQEAQVSKKDKKKPIRKDSSDEESSDQVFRTSKCPKTDSKFKQKVFT